MAFFKSIRYIKNLFTKKDTKYKPNELTHSTVDIDLLYLFSSKHQNIDDYITITNTMSNMILLIEYTQNELDDNHQLDQFKKYLFKYGSTQQSNITLIDREVEKNHYYVALSITLADYVYLMDVFYNTSAILQSELSYNIIFKALLQLNNEISYRITNSELAVIIKPNSLAILMDNLMTSGVYKRLVDVGFSDFEIISLIKVYGNYVKRICNKNIEGEDLSLYTHSINIFLYNLAISNDEETRQTIINHIMAMKNLYTIGDKLIIDNSITLPLIGKSITDSHLNNDMTSISNDIIDYYADIDEVIE